MKSALSVLAFLLMMVSGLVIFLGLIYLIFPPALPVVIALYVICLLALGVQSQKKEASLATIVVGLPLMIGCLVMMFFMILFAWIPATLNGIYIALLKSMFRFRQTQPRVEIKTQQKFDNLGAGYYFSLRGEIDKNAKGRKGKVILRQSAIYLGKDIGWIRMSKLQSVFPPQLSVDTGKDIVEFKPPAVVYPNVLPTARYSKFGRNQNQVNNLRIKINIPERPALDEDLPIGTRHEWELRVGDELYLEGQLLLEHRTERRRNMWTRRIKYEKMEIINPREWVIYEPDEDDIAIATRERQHLLFVNRTKEPVLTVETIADFMALEAGQRFVIHGKIADDNETLWKDYVLYRPDVQLLYGRWTKGKNYDSPNFKTLRVTFADGTYPFNLTLHSNFLSAPGDPSHKISLTKNGNFKVKFPVLKNPTLTEGIQDKSRVYKVLKAGDRVIVHARKLTDIASSALGVEPPAFDVEQVIVNTNRDWVMHGWEDRSPIELAYWERQVERDKKRQIKRNTNAGKQLRKSLGLPPTTPRFGQSSGTNQSKSGTHNRFGQSGGNPFTGSRFGQSGASRFTKRPTSDAENQNTIEPEGKSKHNPLKPDDDPKDENEK